MRRHMVEVIGIHTDLLVEELGKAVLDEQILTVMLRIPRHLFVPESLAQLTYQVMPLPIGFEKTISQCARRSWRFPTGESPVGVRQ